MIDLGTANSLADLVEAAHSAEERLGNQMLWCRGHAQAHWNLVPSAHRRSPVLEAQLTNLFKIKAPAFATNCPNQNDYAGWLPLMQHYGLPTRLLDWSESLVTATFFSVSYEQREGRSCVWLIAPGRLNEINLEGSIPSLESEIVLQLLQDAFRWIEQDDKVAAVLAPHSDLRMAAQKGAYTLHGNREPLEDHELSDEFLAKVVIPEEAKGNIKSDLLTAGASLSGYFPDLGHLATEIAQLRDFSEPEDGSG